MKLLLLLAASAGLSSAAVLKQIRDESPAPSRMLRRQYVAPTTNLTDGDILNYALTLEHLEDTFYRTGLANFTEADFTKAGYNGSFYNNLKMISSDETTHVSFLTSALKAANVTPVAACNYSFPVTDPKTFLATASALEGVGVSAYLGAAADIMNKTYLTAAASILTTESRHSAYIRAQLDESPFASPFDVPLDPDEVYTLAAAFIKSCPMSNPALPVKAFPSLTYKNTSSSPALSNSTATFMTNASSSANGTVYGAFITVTGPIIVPAQAVSGGFSLMVPANVSGQSYVVLTDSNMTVSDDTITAGPAIIEVNNPSSPKTSWSHNNIMGRLTTKEHETSRPAQSLI
ncbi:MAG: hypothetical protein M1819_004070 [Sarea resinae]|nr:MAG: hypothetical protein M1819_004070 [Sarea resinae]